MILDLPDELLTEILDHLVHDTFVNEFFFRRNANDFLPYTQICRHLRSVALTPRLWRYIDISHPRFYKEFVARSKSAFISLIMSSGKLAVEPADLLLVADRIRGIDIEHILELVPVIKASSQWLSSLTFMSGSGFIFIDCDFPSLGRLVLNNAMIKWGSCTKLMDLYLSGGITITYTEVHGLLSRSPCLQVCSLDIAVTHTTGVSLGAISLPNLQRITLSIGSVACSHLLAEIHTVPASAIILINDDQEYPKEIDFLPAGNSHLLPLQITPTTTLGCRLGKEPGNCFYLYPSNTKPWLTSRRFQAQFAPPIRVVHNNSGDPTSILFYGPMFSAILSHFQLSIVTTLELITGPDTSAISDIHDFLLAMPALHALRIDRRSAHVIFSALNGCEDPNSPPPCPALYRIEMGLPTDNWQNISPSFQIPIVESFQRRFNSLLRPLPMLIFFGRGVIDTEVVALLAPYVGRLIITMAGRKGDKELRH